jgi:hypothetical protein
MTALPEPGKDSKWPPRAFNRRKCAPVNRHSRPAQKSRNSRQQVFCGRSGRTRESPGTAGQNGRRHGRFAACGLFGQAESIAEPLRQSLTYDQRKELSSHKQLTARTGVKVYFCGQHSPRQRGTCENTNGLLRQYLPEGTDLSVFSQDELDAIADSMNGRRTPRQSHLPPGQTVTVKIFDARPEDCYILNRWPDTSGDGDAVVSDGSVRLCIVRLRRRRHRTLQLHHRRDGFWSRSR